MSYGIPFRCDVGGEASVNATSPLCLNGGVCRMDPTTLRQYCECPSGFMHDFTAGHFPNCGMTSYAWAIMTGVVATLSTISMFVAVPAMFELRSLVRRIAAMIIAAMVFNMAMMLSIWIEGGAFAAFYVCLFLFNVTVYRFLMDTVILFTTPVYALVQSDLARFKTKVFAMELTNGLAQFGSVIPIIVFARDEDASKFNLYTVIFLLIFSIGMMSLGALNVKQTYMLRGKVDTLMLARPKEDTHVGGSTRLPAVRKRVDLLYVQHVIMLFVFMLLMVFPVVILILGSFPGQYVLLFFMNLSVPFFATGSITLFRQANSADPDAESGGPGPSSYVANQGTLGTKNGAGFEGSVSHFTHGSTHVN